MITVAGSLWSVDPSLHLETAYRLRDAGLRRLHWDMTDGRFAAAGGFTAATAAALSEQTGLSSEAHVMAIHSANEVDAWTGFCDSVIVHVESEDWADAVDRIERRGARAGLAISPGTDVSAVPADIDVLCMSIVPGQAGSTFLDTVLATISELRIASPTRRIGVDGGVRRAHVDALTSAGADWTVVGTDLVAHTAAWDDVLRDD